MAPNYTVVCVYLDIEVCPEVKMVLYSLCGAVPNHFECSEGT